LKLWQDYQADLDASQECESTDYNKFDLEDIYWDWVEPTNSSAADFGLASAVLLRHGFSKTRTYWGAVRFEAPTKVPPHNNPPAFLKATSDWSTTNQAGTSAPHNVGPYTKNSDHAQVASKKKSKARRSSCIARSSDLRLSRAACSYRCN
jgi:hypothetical protein